MAKKAKPAAEVEPNNRFSVSRGEDETPGFATARSVLAPDFRHAVAASQIHKAYIGAMEGAPGFGDYADAIRAKGDVAANGDLAFASRLLSAQAVTLDNIFTEMARRMAINMAEFLGATETYARIALKAQAQSRATLEALAKLHQPREQTVRHVHVNEGGQAVIADQFHHHTGGPENGHYSDQPHGAGTGTVGGGLTLLGHDAQGNGLPIPGDQGRETVQNARRQGKRRT